MQGILAVFVAVCLLTTSVGAIDVVVRDKVESETEAQARHAFANVAAQHLLAEGVRKGWGQKVDAEVRDLVIAETPNIVDALRTATDAGLPLAPIMDVELGRTLSKAGVHMPYPALGLGGAHVISGEAMRFAALGAPRALDAAHATLKDATAVEDLRTISRDGTPAGAAQDGGKDLSVVRCGGLESAPRPIVPEAIPGNVLTADAPSLARLLEAISMDPEAVARAVADDVLRAGPGDMTEDSALLDQLGCLVGLAVGAALLLAGLIVVLLIVLALIVVFGALILAARVATWLWQFDDDRDGYGDAWFKQFQERAEDLKDHVLDLDQDGLTNINEFRWLTIPIGPFPIAFGICAFCNAHDFDWDNWPDGEEVAYWNDETNDPLTGSPAWTTAGLALVDPDYAWDIDGDLLNTTHDPDSDNDGLIDGYTITALPGTLYRENLDRVPGLVFVDNPNGSRTYFGERTLHTYPEFADSDCRIGLDDCEGPGATTHQRHSRKGEPGTGDGIKDGAELARWLAIATDAWATDYDKDGLPSNLMDPDADGDGLGDGAEFDCGATSCTQPHLWDTDADGLLDGDDVTVGNDDPRYDLFANAGVIHIGGDMGTRVFLGEARTGTDPLNVDTDGDTMPDGWEVKHNLDPLDASDANEDADADRLTNAEEYAHGSNPNLVDSDLDELSDFDEVRVYRTAPGNWDTDGDGMPDGWELKHELNPLDPADADVDADGDSFETIVFTNLREYRYFRPASWNEATQGAWPHGTDPGNWDTDGDGISDGEEAAMGTFPGAIVPGVDPNDPDRDGLLTSHERRIGTDPTDPDSDGDGLCDGGRRENCISWSTGLPGAPGEVLDYHSNPHHADSDGDGLTDLEEARHFDPDATGSIPDVDQDGRNSLLDPDSDDDGLPDLNETVLGTNALKADTDGDTLTDYEEADVYFYNDRRTDPTKADTDGDGIPDGVEFNELGTDPTLADSDKDGLTDKQELQLGTKPLRWDTDRDGMPDGWEVYYGLNPLVDDANRDEDRDFFVLGLTNLQEYSYNKPAWWFEHRDGVYWGGTNPQRADTDRDGIDDYTEYMTGILDARADDSQLDLDGDGLSSLLEYALGTNVLKKDSDDDGLDDNEEVGGHEPLTFFNLPNATLTGRGTPAWDAWRLLALPERTAESPAQPNDTRMFLALATPTTMLVSDPNHYDTDGDGLLDGEELAYWNSVGPDAWRTRYRDQQDVAGFAFEQASAAATSAMRAAGRQQDVTIFHSNLREPDSDGDGFDDGQEVKIFHTLPYKADTDDDGFTDYQEIMACGTNPRDPNENCATVGRAPDGADSDLDGLTDQAEREVYGTDPNKADTDGDLLDDGVELIAWGPDDWRTAYDEDGTLNNLVDPDADDDGLLDGIEFASSGLERRRFYISSPRHADTDEDGLTDSEEDTNGLAGEGEARRRSLMTLPRVPMPTSVPTSHNGKGATSPLLPEASTNEHWWTGVDDIGYYVRGAFGIKLYGLEQFDLRAGLAPNTQTTNDGSNAGNAGRNNAQDDDDPWLDARDYDMDQLMDGVEVKLHGSKWNDRDSDGDGIRDDDEVKQGTNPNRVDTDGDGLADWEEARMRGDGTWPTDKPLPIDGDSDDDGLLDGVERGLGQGSTEVMNPDSDGDGLPDGLEKGLRAPQEADGFGTLWTNREATFGCDGMPIRPTFIASLAGSPYSDPLKHDTDGDGLIDGLEDLNANGIRDAGELDARNIDSDGDQVADGVEVRIWGNYRFCDILKHYSYDLAALAAATRFDSTRPLEMDPHNRDTDGDGVPDGPDLNPRGATKLLVEFLTYQQLQPIDRGCLMPGCLSTKYSPELYFDLTITTGAGQAVVHVPTLPELHLADASSVGNLGTLLDGRKPVPRGTILKELAKFDGGLLTIPLPDDFNLYNVAEVQGERAAPDEVIFVLHAGDADGEDHDASDVVDLWSGQPGGTDFRFAYRLAHGGGRAGGVILTSDGAGDDSWFANADDDARISLRYVDTLFAEFVNKARTAVQGSSIVHAPPETSQTMFGDR